MELHHLSMQALKYLYKNRGRDIIIYGAISSDHGWRSWQKAEEACKPLVEAGFAEAEEYKVKITKKGEEFLVQYQKHELDEIYETIFDNFEFTLLRYFYKHREPMQLEELPEIFTKEVPRYTTGLDMMNLIHLLEIEAFKKYIKHDGNRYQINDNGVRYFEYLISSAKTPTVTPVHTIAPVYNIHVDRSNIVGTSTESIVTQDNREVHKKPGSLMKKIIIGVIITVLGGLIVWWITTRN